MRGKVEENVRQSGKRGFAAGECSRVEANRCFHKPKGFSLFPTGQINLNGEKNVYRPSTFLMTRLELERKS